jgi:outer membrane protein assembly factor BamE (lipoprotein component of BamABCDE complex)
MHQINLMCNLHKLFLSLACVTLFLLSGCASIGNDFPVSELTTIEIGKTTQKQVRDMLGSPWRTGLESGQKTWTYGSYSYSLFKDNKAKDLVIRFDQNNVVASYTFSTTEHSE